MSNTSTPERPALVRDITAGLVVFLVALPLCLGIALASNAPLVSGLIAGIVGGLKPPGDASVMSLGASADDAVTPSPDP